MATSSSGGSSTPRSSSRSRSKRSTTNLADLRLAPLSTKFASAPRNYDSSAAAAPRSPYETPPSATFARQHSSYLQGKSAPTTPGILSRSSSRRHLAVGGGLSRRGSLYDDDAGGYEYAAVPSAAVGGKGGGMVARERAEMGSGNIPKAKSEAALAYQQRRLQQLGGGKGLALALRKQQQQQMTRSGTSTPRPRYKLPHPITAADDDWLTRTGAATNALLQESKGQSWLASSSSHVSLTADLDTLTSPHLSNAVFDDDDDDDDDDNYEEMAALSASTAKLNQYTSASATGPLSPALSQHRRPPTWGSRYGSRSASRRTSRRGSMTNNSARTPLSAVPPPGDAIPGYFDEEPLAFPLEPDFVDDDGAAAGRRGASDVLGGERDEAEIARLTAGRTFGLGSLVDRLMTGFDLFKVEEREEGGSGSGGVGAGSEEEGSGSGRLKGTAERKVVRVEEARARDDASSQGKDERGAGEHDREGGWNDAAWLMSVASKAMFQ